MQFIFHYVVDKTGYNSLVLIIHGKAFISDELQSISLRSLQWLETLGKGGFGRVELVKSEGKTFALKVR
uniref:Protein kinase domain-containing protein n=1 Tax=Heterorhabditis bacteriophora TaxID=37862 RepID=A0A1I7XVA7_HETBA